MPEVIYKADDESKTILTVREAMAVVQGDRITWETPDGEVYTGPITDLPQVGGYVDKDGMCYAYAMFCIETGGEYWEDFIEAYPCGKDGEPATEALVKELQEIADQRGK